MRSTGSTGDCVFCLPWESFQKVRRCHIVNYDKLGNMFILYFFAFPSFRENFWNLISLHYQDKNKRILRISLYVKGENGDLSLWRGYTVWGNEHGNQCKRNSKSREQLQGCETLCKAAFPSLVCLMNTLFGLDHFLFFVFPSWLMWLHW